MLLYHFNDDDYRNKWIMAIKIILGDLVITNNLIIQNRELQKLRIPYVINVYKSGMQILIHFQKG